ncbi:MAG TPA: dienelactone hydrolase family protein [Candidatus Eremiobacteraceae bacterium]
MEQLAISDGTIMSAYVSPPRGKPNGAGMLVFQEAFGVNAYIRDIADRFAALGFTALAPELFHRTGPGFEGSYDDFEAVRPHVSALKTPDLEADVRAAFDRLSSIDGVDPDRVAAIGFCMGGRVSYIANATVRLRAAVSYYGSVPPDLLDLAQRQHGPLLMYWGGKDKHITPDHYRAVADALSQHGKLHEQVVFSQADHGFFCDRRSSYEPGAAVQSWALTQEFLRVFGVYA